MLLVWKIVPIVGDSVNTDIYILLYLLNRQKLLLAVKQVLKLFSSLVAGPWLQAILDSPCSCLTGIKKLSKFIEYFRLIMEIRRSLEIGKTHYSWDGFSYA